MSRKLEGGCQCGNIRYALEGEPVFAAICHCTMCRRAHAAPAVGWALYPTRQVTFTKAKPKFYASSNEGQRGFCAECGTQVSFDATFLQDLIDIPIGSLDDPNAIKPTLHFWYSQHLDWVEFADDLPRHAEFPPFGEG